MRFLGSAHYTTTICATKVLSTHTSPIYTQVYLFIIFCSYLRQMIQLQQRRRGYIWFPQVSSSFLKVPYNNVRNLQNTDPISVFIRPQQNALNDTLLIIIFPVYALCLVYGGWPLSNPLQVVYLTWLWAFWAHLRLFFSSWGANSVTLLSSKLSVQLPNSSRVRLPSALGSQDNGHVALPPIPFSPAAHTELRITKAFAPILYD